MNYRLVHDRKTGHFYIHNHTTFPSINLLLGHYRAAPINAEVNTRLLFPVTPPGQATPTNDGEDAYVIMERRMYAHISTLSRGILVGANFHFSVEKSIVDTARFCRLHFHCFCHVWKSGLKCQGFSP